MNWRLSADSGVGKHAMRDGIRGDGLMAEGPQLGHSSLLGSRRVDLALAQAQ